MAYQTYIKSHYSDKTLAEILASPTSVLLGVNDAAATELAKLNVASVFDLAVSSVFGNAARVVAASSDPRSVMRRYGRAASSIVDPDVLNVVTPSLPFEDLGSLAGVSATSATALETQLTLETIRDVAYWPPFLAARAIMLEAYNPPVEDPRDPDAPVSLVPRSGEFGTERYLYSSVVMFPGKFLKDPTPLKGKLFDITAVPSKGFDMVRFGARLTYSHTWSPVAVAKGHLLHSLPLAPGESTNVAVISWTNKSSAASRQSLTESERLSSVVDRERTVSQIANSVANEFTSGSSSTLTQSVSAQGGVGGLIGLFTGSAAISANESTGHTHTVSTGERSIATTLQQNIQDATQQVSSSLRSQRAASVSEVNQEQSEQLSTRSVTNYNHMHALTIQYYEVVQAYETETRLQNAERCIFIPLKLLDFTDERNIVRYQYHLKAVALDGRTRALLAELEGQASKGYQLTYQHSDRAPLVNNIAPWLPPLGAEFRSQLRGNARELDEAGMVSFSGDINNLALNFELEVQNVRWSPVRAMAPRTPIVSVTFVLEDGTSLQVTQSAAANAAASTVNGAFGGGPLSFGRIRAITLETNPAYNPMPPFTGAHDEEISLEFAVKLDNVTHWLDCSFRMRGNAGPFNGQVLYTVTAPSGLTELGETLNENRLWYSQQVWMREDPQARIMQLAPFQIKLDNRWVSLVDFLPPQPLQVVGNYLVYRFTYEEDAAWVKWVKANVDRSKVSIDVVAVPTGGVFAEAVLGRSNSAEKFDATRFFDWDDSPPPKPPAIGPIAAGTHTPADAPEIGQFAPQMVGFQQAPAVTDPVSLSALMTAIVANPFRDMSAAAVSGAAATAALDASKQMSIGAMQAAGNALVTTLNTVADVFTAATTEKGLSTIGALINEKQGVAEKKADEKKAAENKAAADGAAPAAANAAADANVSHATKVQEAVVNAGLAAQGVPTAPTSPPAATPVAPAVPAATDPALLNSNLINDPAFADVAGFVTLLQSVPDGDLIEAIRRRFATVDASVDLLDRYREFTDVVARDSATLIRPERLLYAAEFLKTGTLPIDARFDLGVVGAVRNRALEIAVERAMTTARQVNPGASARTAISEILSACAHLGVTGVNPVSYVLATAYHECGMGASMTELAPGMSSDTVFTKDAYFFNRIPGKKASYNTLAGNVKAGDDLLARALITAANVPAWNGTAYPDAQPDAVKIAARACDFYRFRGRGYVQLTGRARYLAFSTKAELGNLDFVADPERVLEPAAAATIMVLGMRSGSFGANGEKLADYDLAAGWDATNARATVNTDTATNGARVRTIAQQFKEGLLQFVRIDESKALI